LCISFTSTRICPFCAHKWETQFFPSLTTPTSFRSLKTLMPSDLIGFDWFGLNQITTQPTLLVRYVSAECFMLN
jgi:hypothetical protein